METKRGTGLQTSLKRHWSIISEYQKRETPEQQQWYERYCRMMPEGIKLNK